MTEYIKDITLENAQSLLIEESFNRIVLVDFWADWCGPCKSLMPILEKLADEYAGVFLLAKVDADEMQMIASQFGVRSLPTVMVMQNGQPVDGFSGLKSEQEVRELLEKYLPKPWDADLQAAQGHMASGEFNEAFILLRKAYADSDERVDITVTLADVSIRLKRFDDAEQFLARVKLADQNDYFEQVKAALELAREAQKAPELTRLEEKLVADPKNDDIRYQLAVQYSQHEFQKEALQLLFELLEKDLQSKSGDVKKVYLDILATLSKGDPLAVEYQRKLYTLIY